MKVHHVSCATMCPASRRLVNGVGGYLETGEMCCHVLIVETDRDGIVLVDTGLGTADVADPKRRLGAPFVAATRPRLAVEETALRRVEALGHSLRDVRHVVPTHLDLDHAGGLSDFPDADVHVHAAELAAATTRPTRHDRMRYRPIQLAHGPKWVEYSEEGEDWMGFRRVRAIAEDVYLVPTPGHSRGHVAVAVRDGDRWLLHCGDAYFFHGEVDGEAPCPPGLTFFQWYVAYDDAARKANRDRLRARYTRTSGSGEVALFSAHCPVELARFEKGSGGATIGA